MLNIDTAFRNSGYNFTGANEKSANKAPDKGAEKAPDTTANMTLDKAVIKTHAGLKTGAAAALVLNIPTLMALFRGNFRAINWPSIGALVTTTLGCGAIVDAVINNKRENGEPNNAVGKKLGTALGAVTLPLLGVFNHGTKMIFSKQGAIVSAIASACGAIGGLILGAITDKCANHAQKKHEA